MTAPSSTPLSVAQFEDMWRRLSGTGRWFSVVNNQVLGARIMVLAFLFFIMGVGMALLMRVQLAHGDNTFLSPADYNRLFTMHGSIMMYMFIVPFLEGLAVYMLPVLLGSRDMAFPRLTALGFWLYLIGGSIFLSSFFVGPGPDMGWFAYTPLSGPRYAGPAIDLWLWGLTLVEVGGIVTAVEIVVTVLKLRTPGMSLDRMPIFAWAMLVAGVMMVFAFSTLLTATLMLEADRTFGTAYFDPARGGSSLLWQHLFWFFGHPEVYIMFIPAVGIVSMIIPSFARRPMAAYTLLVVSTIVMGFVSFGLWMHHMFTTGLPELSMAFFSAASLMIALASGTQVFAWIATLWGTRPALHVPLLYVLGALALFVIGGMTGVMVAVVPFDLQVHDTYFVVAHFHYVLIGGVLFPILGGLAYWLPKMTGYLLDRRLGTWTFVTIFIGFNLTFFPMHAMGLSGLPRRVYTYSSSLGLDGLNTWSTIGSFILAAGLAGFAADFLSSLRRRAAAGMDPWGGSSLEWGIASPPPSHNHFAQPVVESRDPLWGKPTAGTLAGLPAEFRATLVTGTVTTSPQALLYLPGPTFRPAIAALGGGIIALAAVVKWAWLAALGCAIVVAMLVGWLWPDRREAALLESSAIQASTGLTLFPTGSQAPGYWGMIGVLGVLATMFGALLYGYFYIWLFSPRWPQEGLPRPDLWPAGAGYGLLAASSMAVAWPQSRRQERAPVGSWGGLLAAAVAGAAFVVIDLASLLRSGFAPTVNAYSTAFFVPQTLHLVFTAIGVALLGAGAWLAATRSSPWAPLIAQVAALYWHGMVTIGVVLFGALYLAPHVLGNAR